MHRFKPPTEAREAAQMAESVDALVSNTSGATRAGSTPALGTLSAQQRKVVERFFCVAYTQSWGNGYDISLNGAADLLGCRMKKVICLRVHRCTFYHSQMLIYPFTDAHLYVYRCRAVKLPQACGKATAAERQSYHRPVVDVKVFIEKRNNLDSRLIMTKLGTLRSQFMKPSVYKGEISIYAERQFSFPEIRLYLHATALLQHEKWKNIRHKDNTNWEYPLTLLNCTLKSASSHFEQELNKRSCF